MEIGKDEKYNKYSLKSIKRFILLIILKHPKIPYIF